MHLFFWTPFRQPERDRNVPSLAVALLPLASSLLASVHVRLFRAAAVFVQNRKPRSDGL